MRGWVVRLGKGGELADRRMEKGVITIGWPKVGDLASFSDYEAVKRKLPVLPPRSPLREMNPGISETISYIRRSVSSYSYPWASFRSWVLKITTTSEESFTLQ